MINRMFQPEGSSLCGQTCVAMIASVSLEESIEAFGGKRGGTRTRDVVAALRKLGVKCGDPPLIRLRSNWNWSDLGYTSIVKLHFEWTKTTHWTLWHDNRFYDPSEIGQETLYKNIAYPKGVRLTSYLPIYLDA